MHKGIIKTASLIGALSVALGAFGAHGLKKFLDPQALNVFETAVRYQFYHVFALLAVGLLYKDFASAALLNAARFFIMGILLFCGSLYVLTFLAVQQTENFKWVVYRDWETDRKSTRLNSSHSAKSRMPSSA